VSSPAEIIAALIVKRGIGATPSRFAEWPVHEHLMPGAPDSAIVVYDTSPVLDGRLMSGPVVKKPGVQIEVRAAERDYSGGWNRIEFISIMLDSVLREGMSMADGDVVIVAVHRTSGPVSLGQEPERRRWLFTYNAVLTLSAA
jgi:hypothetical protein